MVGRLSFVNNDAKNSVVSQFNAASLCVSAIILP